MDMAKYEGPFWTVKQKGYHDDLLKLLTAKDTLVVLKHGKPPYRVVLGVPHQAAVGEGRICENTKPRDSDENAASYALVAFSLLKEHEIPCKIVVAAHSTQEDPNKDLKSEYCQELFGESTELIWECHGLNIKRKLDLELSAGPNDSTDTLKYGKRIASPLKGITDIGIQKQAGLSDALIINKDGSENPNGFLERPGIDTDSLEEARKRKIPSLHLEAKPRFRIPDNKKDEVSPDGCLLGYAIAQAIMQDWLDGELEKVEKSYTAQVLNMTGAYHREIERKKEYQGRQLLELLQNADDEAENLQEPGVLIRLEENRLVVANHGLPFTAQGILSLMYSDNSPKIKRQKKIGYKGLGFRAILNWSESVHIKSGAFSLEFSRPNAIDFLNQLIVQNPTLKEEMENTGSGDHPIATLAAPMWKPADSSLMSAYDTSVVINFSSDDVRQDIQAQINELGLEVALFLNNLKEIKLESPERTETVIRKPATADGFEVIQLLDKDGVVKDSKRWRIFPKSGEVPKDLRNENAKQYEYDLRIAVSDKLDDNINRLFCYFKTEVNLPFPAIIHGTFELDGNRNHLTETKVNEFLLERLAELMTETAKTITQSQTPVTWDAMKLLARRGDLDDKLKKMNFYKKLLTSIRKEGLIPVLSNKYMSAEEKPVFYDIPLAETLEGAPSDFPELALYTPDKEIQALLREPELRIGPYSPEELVKKLNNLPKNFTLNGRAQLIILLANNYDKCLKPLEPDKTPRLFVDDQGQPIAANTKAFLPPERARFQLPETVRLVFISSDLTMHLRKKAGVNSNDALAEKLTCFNVQPYRAAAVIGRIVANTNRTINKIPSKKKEYLQQMVQALFMISSDETNPDSKFPEKVNVPLFTRKGGLRNARELYFGSEYSNGKIMDALYSGLDDTAFVTNKDELGLAANTESEAVKFLKWVGVEEFPRMSVKKLEKESYDSGYEAFVLKNLKYPYQTTWSETYQDYNKLEGDKQYRSVITVHDIPELETILSKAKFEHVLTWLHLDPRIQEILRKGCEPSGSRCGLWLYKKQQTRNLREGEISPYILWKLRTTEWVKAKRSHQHNAAYPTISTACRLLLRSLK